VTSPEPAPVRTSVRLGGIALTVLIAVILNLFTLLLLPFRVGGHLVPLSAVLAFVVNAALGSMAIRLLRSRLPGQLVLATAIGVSVVVLGRGPGGDLLVTQDLQTMYLLFVLGAALGASVPLFVRAWQPPG
jgi:hypothetical protein